MPHLTRSVDADSTAALTLHVGLSCERRLFLRSKGIKVPRFAAVTAIIDTGANRTVIDSDVLASIGLVNNLSVGRTAMYTPSTGGVPVYCYLFDVALTILDARQSPTLLIDPLQVVATSMSGTGTKALIGLDVLNGRYFAYDGLAKTFTLAF